jgi:hypothetical protein
MLETKQCQITLVERDYQSEEDIPTEPCQCTKEAVEAALATSTLTPEQCVWLHTQGINWEIRLRERVVRLRKGKETWAVPIFLSKRR